MLQGLWDSTEGYRVVAIKKGKLIRNNFFTSNSEAVDFATKKAKDKDTDVYFSPCLFSDKERKQEKAQYVKAFWIDVDANGREYETKQEAYEAIQAFLAKLSLPTPSLVDTGGGYQLYWPLSYGVTAQDWLPVAQRLKQACVAYGLKSDPTRTADYTSVMRAPFSFNTKWQAAVQVLQEGAESDINYFASRLPALVPVIVHSKVSDFNAKFLYSEPFPKVNLKEVLSSCKQMQSLVQTALKGDKVTEPQWRGMLSIISRCENGEQLAHVISSKDSRYSQEETQKKIAGTDAPFTCSYFCDHNPTACLACPVRNKIKSPISVGLLPKTVEAPLPKGEIRLDKVGLYEVTNKGVYKSPDPEDPKDEGGFITACPLWIVGVKEKNLRENDYDRSLVNVRWFSLDGASKLITVAQEVCYDKNSFKQWLANNNLMAQVYDEVELVSYIKKATREIIRRREVEKYYDSLGWYANGFVVGDKLITKDGDKTISLAKGSQITGLKAKGTAQNWAQGVKGLANKDYWMHAFTVLAGFGSPLLELAGVQCAVLSLFGESGFGKTLSAKTALSIYGQHTCLWQSAKDTMNAKEKQMSMLRNLPYLVDEVTGVKPTELADFVYMAANGQGKATLNRNRDSRNVGSWALTPIVTSNRPLLEHRLQEFQEAHRRRVVELSFNVKLDEATKAGLIAAHTENYGAIAPIYLKRLVGVRGSVKELFSKAESKLRSLHKVDEANRFGLWLIESAYVGGLIAKSAGLINWDIDYICTKALQTLSEQSYATTTDEGRIRDVIADFTSLHNGDITIFNQQGSPINDPRVVLGRQDLKAGVLYLSVQSLDAYLLQEGIARANIRNWLNTKGITKKNMRLAVNGAAVYSYRIPLNLLQEE